MLYLKADFRDLQAKFKVKDGAPDTVRNYVSTRVQKSSLMIASLSEQHTKPFSFDLASDLSRSNSRSSDGLPDIKNYLLKIKGWPKCETSDYQRQHEIMCTVPF